MKQNIICVVFVLFFCICFICILHSIPTYLESGLYVVCLVGPIVGVPFLVMRDVFFCHLMKTNDPHIVLSHTFFCSQVIPDFCEKTHKAIEDELAKSLEPCSHHR